MSETARSPRELVEILLLDQHQRWRRGERILVESYLQQHPRLACQNEEVLDLLYNEIVLRGQRGETPQVEEYRQRFPHLAAMLQMQFDVHQALGPGEPLPASLSAERITAKTVTPIALPAVPGYEILGELGRGGMGAVYKARQTSLGRLVALKLIRSGRRPSTQQLARFRLEAEAVAQLQHPNIVQLFEVGEHEGWPYFSLELVEGGTLATHCDGRPQPPRAAAALIETLAHAVHFAHLHGIVHRDLKPANILLSGEPRVESGEPNTSGLSALRSPLSAPKITDFGLAKRLDRDTQLTRLGDILGTPRYMAAEQARGRPEEIGPGTDVFGLGAILYELLTGQPPVAAANVAAALAEVREMEPKPPRQLCCQVPRDLEAICLKCLRKRPQDRYASAEALADDLGRFLRGEPVRARPVGTAIRCLKWARRRPIASSFMVLTALALLAVSFLGWHSKGQLQIERDQAVSEGRVVTDQRDALRQAKEEIEIQRDAARSAKAEVEAQRDTAQRAREEAERQRQAVQQRLQEAQRSLYALQLAQVAALWTSEPNRGLEILDDPVRCPPPLRDFTWGLLRRGCSRSHVDLEGPKGAVHAVAYSPTNCLLAAAGADAKLWLWDLATAKPRSLEGHADHVLSVAFSADGKWLASAGTDHTVRVWEVESGKPRWMLNDIKSSIYSVAFNASGTVLALGCGDGNVRMWLVAKATESVELSVLPLAKKGRQQPLHKGPVYCVAFSPDGHTFASASEDHTIKLWDTTTALLYGTLTGHHQPVYVLAFSPNGRNLASGGGDGTVRLWDTARSAQRVKLQGHIGAVHALAFAPDGRTLATGSANLARSQRSTVPEVKLWDANTGQLHVSSPHSSGDIHALVFVENGRQLALGGDRPAVELWDAWLTLERATVRHQEEPIRALAIAPDGKTVALAGKDKSIRLCDPLTGQVRLTLSHGSEVRALAFTSDRRMLVSAGEDGTVKLWKADTRRLRQTLNGHKGAVNAIAISPDGEMIASAGNDRTVRLWKRETGKELRILIGHQDGATAAIFSPDGHHVFSAGRDGRLQCWDLSTGQARTVLHVPEEAILSLALSPDGQSLACGGSDGLVRLLDWRQGKERLVLRGHRGVVLTLAFSPDGRTLVSGAAPDDQGRVQAPGEVKLWDPITGQVRAMLRGHGDGVTGAAFAPDNRLLITASWDGTVKFWEALPSVSSR